MTTRDCPTFKYALIIGLSDYISQKSLIYPNFHFFTFTKQLIFHAQIHNAPLLVPLAAVFHLVLNQKLISNQIIGPVLAIKNHN